MHAISLLSAVLAASSLVSSAALIPRNIEADEILVFDQGRISARGNHARLMDSSPIYRKLYEKQEL